MMAPTPMPAPGVAPTFPSIKIDSFWLPRQSSTLAPEVDWAWDVVMLVSIVLFFVVIIPMVYFTLKYKRRSDDDTPNAPDHNTTMEIVWSVIPLFIVIGLFVIGLKGYVNASVSPAEPYEIHVQAQRWSWSFTYPNGIRSFSGGDGLVVPKGRPVKLIMSSTDVLHSLFISEFRVKNDVIPGLYTTVWFEATEELETTMQCTEYCGKDHSNMLAKVRVLEEPKFREWLDLKEAEEMNMPPVELGAKLYVERQCNTCHSVDGSRITGPTFKGLFGSTEQTTAGPVKVDENYLRESILNPQAKVVVGYPANMPSFQGQLKEKQIEGLIAFIKAQQ